VGAGGALTNFLRVAYIPCVSPGDLICEPRRLLLILLGALGNHMFFGILVPQGSLGAFCKRSSSLHI
jgi:hypothetical protein